ncbi:MAG: hypothetical protein IPG60_04075 [Bacteroidetes bacterium]|nr:hypothetical protein [Bacteroidota bacterium]
MKFKYITLILFVVAILFFANSAEAQCAMCKITAESGSQAADPPAPGLNQGILYLVSFPYIAFIVIVFLFWRGYKKRKAEAAEYGVQDF